MNIILKYVLEIVWNYMDWIDMAHDMDYWRALVNTLMNLWLP
jgi:hypothetical protein